MNHNNLIKKLTKPKFNRAFVLKPGFRFDALRFHCNSIVFATDGLHTDLARISSQLMEAFSDFDPKHDCIVPIGNTYVNMLAGYLLRKIVPDSNIVIAIFNGEERKLYEDPIPEHYVFYEINPQDLFDPEKFKSLERV